MRCITEILVLQMFNICNINNNNNNNLFFSCTNNIKYYNSCDATHLSIKRRKIDKAMPVCGQQFDHHIQCLFGHLL